MCYQTEQTNYEKNKILLEDKARDKYRDLSDEEERIKREYGRNRYHNMSKEKKQKSIVRLKNLNLIINIFYGFNSPCFDLVTHY